jgi:hypothetical protein
MNRKFVLIYCKKRSSRVTSDFSTNFVNVTKPTAAQWNIFFVLDTVAWDNMYEKTISHIVPSRTILCDITHIMPGKAHYWFIVVMYDQTIMSSITLYMMGWWWWTSFNHALLKHRFHSGGVKNLNRVLQVK